MFKNISINRTQVTVLAAAAIVMSLSIWTFSRAAGTEISMCVKQSGVSYSIGTGFAKQSCNSSEQLVTFNVTGPQGPIGPQGPEGGSVKLYDANDQVIGYITSSKDIFVLDPASGLIEIFDKNLGVFAVVSSYSSQNLSVTTVANSPGGSSVYYESLNCTGQGYMTNLPLIAKDSLLNNGSGYHYAVDETVVTPDYINYQSNGSNVPAVGPCIAESGTISSPTPVRDAQVIIDSYARPFRIGL